MFFQIFIRILSIFLIIFVGTLARKKSIFTDSAINSMASCLINLFYPALIISSITTNFTVKSLISNLILPAGTIMIMFTGYTVGILFSKFLTFENEKQKNTFLFQCTINNYVLLPLPIVAMFFGSSGVGFLIFSTLGSELSVWTIGVFGLTGSFLGKKNIKNLMSTPILALIFSILLVIVRDVSSPLPVFSNRIFKEVASGIAGSIDMFGKATIPLALFVSGGRMYDLSIKHIKISSQMWINFLRLIFIPAAACALFTILPVSYEVFMVLAIVSVMPTAITSVILSEIFKADTDFASSSVLTTHIFSLLTIPAWLTLLTNT